MPAKLGPVNTNFIGVAIDQLSDSKAECATCSQLHEQMTTMPVTELILALRVTPKKPPIFVTRRWNGVTIRRFSCLDWTGF